jgi:plasmid stabilization system protein ParE
MTYRVIIEPRAEQEIREAARWIHAQSRSGRTTQRWVKGLRAKIATLKTHPRRCPVHPDSAYFGEEVRILPYATASVGHTGSSSRSMVMPCTC